VLLGEHILVGAHGVARPPIDVAVVAGPPVGVRDLAEANVENEAARSGVVWCLILLLPLVFLILPTVGASAAAVVIKAELDINARDMERRAAYQE